MWHPAIFPYPLTIELGIWANNSYQILCVLRKHPNYLKLPSVSDKVNRELPKIQGETVRTSIVSWLKAWFKKTLTKLVKSRIDRM
jgi:hypothetical protein